MVYFFRCQCFTAFHQRVSRSASSNGYFHLDRTSVELISPWSLLLLLLLWTTTIHDYNKMSCLILKNGPSPASFSFIFGLFQTNINTILQQIYVKNVHPVYSIGFEPTTVRTWVTRSELLPYVMLNLLHSSFANWPNWFILKLRFQRTK